MIKIVKALLLVLFVSGIEANLPGVVDKPLYDKYSSSAVNLSSLVERDGIKYQVNSTKPFSGRFIGYEDDFGLCVNEAGSYTVSYTHLTLPTKRIV